MTDYQVDNNIIQLAEGPLPSYKEAIKRLSRAEQKNHYAQLLWLIYEGHEEIPDLFDKLKVFTRMRDFDVRWSGHNGINFIHAIGGTSNVWSLEGNLDSRTTQMTLLEFVQLHRNPRRRGWAEEANIARTDDGHSVFDLACLNENSEVVLHYLKKYPGIASLPNPKTGQPPAFEVIKGEKDPELIKAVIGAFPDVAGMRGKDGRPFLHHLVGEYEGSWNSWTNETELDRIELFNFVVETGFADWRDVAADGQTTLMACLTYQNFSRLASAPLSEYRPAPECAFASLLFLHQKEAEEQFHKDNAGRTIIHILAAQCGHLPPRVVQFLLGEHKDNLRAKDNDGNVPLHYAGPSSGLTGIQMIMDGYTGAIQEKNKYGHTPLITTTDAEDSVQWEITKASSQQICSMANEALQLYDVQQQANRKSSAKPTVARRKKRVKSGCKAPTKPKKRGMSPSQASGKRKPAPPTEAGAEVVEIKHQASASQAQDQRIWAKSPEENLLADGRKATGAQYVKDEINRGQEASSYCPKRRRTH